MRNHTALMLTTLLGLFVVGSGCDSEPSPARDTVVATDSETVTDSETADSTVIDDSAAEVVDDTTDDTRVEADTTVVADTAPDTASDTTVTEGTRTEWGTITGACGTLMAALTSSEPSFHRTTWTFDNSTFDPDPLDPGPTRRYEGPNAGGSSKCSEVMSMQLLIECEDAEFYKTETQITYDMEGPITDYAMRINGDIIGVSVTRAYLGPVVNTYTKADAVTLLDKKLDGVVDSSENVSEADRWTKQILHIWTLNPAWVDVLEEAWEETSESLLADTVVLVTVETGADFVVTDSCDD